MSSPLKNTEELDKILDYIHIQTRKPVPSDIREEVVAVGDIIVKEEAKAAILALIVSITNEAVDDYMQDLKDASRDYCKKYPDANINDFIGLIVGVRNQPQRLQALTKKGET